MDENAYLWTHWVLDEMVMGGNVDFGDKNRSYIICHFLANTIIFGLESKYSSAFLFKNKQCGKAST